MTPSGYPHGTTVAADDAPATGAAADAGTTTSAAPAFSKPLPLTRPPVIAGLVAAILLFAVGIAVAATTQVQAREQGDGMVIPGGTFIPVVSPVAGQVRTPPVVSRTMLAPRAGGRGGGRERRPDADRGAGPPGRWWLLGRSWARWSRRGRRSRNWRTPRSRCR